MHMNIATAVNEFEQPENYESSEMQVPKILVGYKYILIQGLYGDHP